MDDDKTKTQGSWARSIVDRVSFWPTALGLVVWGVCFWAVSSGWVLTTSYKVTTAMFVLFGTAILVTAARRYRVAAAVVAGTFAALLPFVLNDIVYRGGVWLLGALALTGLFWFSRAMMASASTRRPVVVGVAGILIASAVGGWVGTDMYNERLGSTHPESTRPVFQDELIDWVWVGNVSTTTADVKARLEDDARSSDVIVEVNPAGQPNDVTVVEAELLSGDVARFELRDLVPDSDYEYRIMSSLAGEGPREPTGEFTTFPEGASSFSLAFGSCARSRSNGVVFETIAAQDPLLYVMVGDLHYQNIGFNDEDLFRDAYDRTLAQPSQASLYRSTPVAYVWDDHDFGENNSDGRSASRAAAFSSYAEHVPGYPASPSAAEVGPSIYRSFTVGRVRVIMTDGRGHRNLDVMPNSSQHSMLGTQQREWLKQELVDASASHELVIWVNPVPWISTIQDDRFATFESVASGDAEDTWGGYPNERAEIANHIADNGIDNIVMVSGDSHMVTIDDGTNSNFSDQPGPGFPILHAAALDRVGSIKGGPYSYDQFPGGGQFGVVDVEDNTTSVNVTLRGMNWENEVLVEHSFALE